MIEVKEFKKGLILSPIQTTEQYNEKSIWAFEGFNEEEGHTALTSATYTEEAPAVLTIFHMMNLF